MEAKLARKGVAFLVDEIARTGALIECRSGDHPLRLSERAPLARLLRWHVGVSSCGDRALGKHDWPSAHAQGMPCIPRGPGETERGSPPGGSAVSVVGGSTGGLLTVVSATSAGGRTWSSSQDRPITVPSRTKGASRGTISVYTCTA